MVRTLAVLSLTDASVLNPVHPPPQLYTTGNSTTTDGHNRSPRTELHIWRTACQHSCGCVAAGTTEQ